MCDMWLYAANTIWLQLNWLLSVFSIVTHYRDHIWNVINYQNTSQISPHRRKIHFFCGRLLDVGDFYFREQVIVAGDELNSGWISSFKALHVALALHQLVKWKSGSSLKCCWLCSVTTRPREVPADCGDQPADTTLGELCVFFLWFHAGQEGLVQNNTIPKEDAVQGLLQGEVCPLGFVSLKCFSKRYLKHDSSQKLQWRDLS